MSHVTKSPAIKPLTAATTVAAEPPRQHKESGETTYRKRLSIRHTANIVARNAAYAAIGRVLVGLLKLLAKKGFSQAFLRRAPGEIFSLDPVKWAAVFGGFSSFRFCMQTVTRIGKIVHLPEKLAAFIAGFLCAAPALVMNRETRTELCLYALVRALHTFTLRFVFPRLPQLLQKFEHYDVLLMCMSAVQISYGCLFAPVSMPKSYQKFLSKASMLDERVMRSFAGVMRGITVPEMTDYCNEHGLAPFTGSSHDAADRICDMFHPGKSCNMHTITFIPRNMLYMGIPLYGPLRVVATLATQRKKLIAHPVKTIVRGVKSVLSSSLFLAIYVACIMRAACLTSHRGDRGGLPLSLMCFSAGLPTLLEPKGRRIDLALYCSMYAIRSFALTQHRLGHLPYPRHWFVLLTYFTSISFLFYEYEEEPNLLNPRVCSAFRMLLGERKSQSHPRAKGRSPALRAKDHKDVPEVPKLVL